MLSSPYHKSPTGIWIRPEQVPFNYSDGDDVETRLHKQIHQSHDVSLASDELQSLITDWPSEYHFSPLRSNLLHPFHLNHFTHILEVGSGCGAITRYLGEQCPKSNILALEGSRSRAQVTLERCSGLENVAVYNDSFTYFKYNTTFDCITMVGVLEYSPSYVKGPDPIQVVIDKAYKLLSTTGVLIIAIENQLGLKYFNGCTEDHSGKFFTGISDSYDPGTFQTLGKQQIKNKIKQAGFNHIEFFYPFPDYKLPRLILTEPALTCNDIDISYLPGQYPSRDYTGNEQRLFSEPWSLLAQNNLIGDMANSFLIFAFKGEENLQQLTDPWQACIFSCPRSKKYLTKTEICHDKSVTTVKKTALYSNQNKTAESVGKIEHHLTDEPYIDGIPYSAGFIKQISQSDTFNTLVAYLKPWIEYVVRHAFRDPSAEHSAKLLLHGKMLDCMPSNIMIDTSNQLCFIDQEWEYNQPIAVGFLLFRGIYRELSFNIALLDQTELFVGKTPFEIIVALFKYFNFHLDDSTLESYIMLEVEIQKTIIIYSVEKDVLQKHLHQFFKSPRHKNLSLNEFFQAGGMNHYTKLKKEQNQAKEQTDNALAEIAAIKSGWSWKLARVLTFLPRLYQNRNKV